MHKIERVSTFYMDMKWIDMYIDMSALCTLLAAYNRIIHSMSKYCSIVEHTVKMI